MVPPPEHVLVRGGRLVDLAEDGHVLAGDGPAGDVGFAEEEVVELGEVGLGSELGGHFGYLGSVS